MTETVNRIAGVWLDWQWAMLWQTAVLIGLVTVIDRLIRNRAWPQLRYALWLLVLIKLVLPPTLTSPVSVTSGVSPLAWKAVQGGMQAQPVSVDSHAAGSAAAPATAQTPLRVGPAATSVVQRTAVVNSPARTTSASPALARTGTSWVVYVMGVWLAGAGVLGTGLCIRMRRLSKEHAVSQPRSVPDWFEDLVATTATELDLRRAPRVVFSKRVHCPAVFGAFRPVLVFPADSSLTTPQETRHVLLHELAHIKRGDLLVHTGYMVLVTLYWINPLLWVIRRHVQNLRELCCDATVAACLRDETSAYRETLLATGRALLARPVDPGLGLLGLFENSGWLPIRLQWLEKETWRHPWLRRASVAAVAILMLCCILPMASIHAGDTAQSEPMFRVTLPSGATLELLGIRRTGTNEWWRPDGAPLADPPYDTSEGTNRTDGYEVALRYENLPEDASGGLGIEQGTWGGSIPMGYAIPRKADKPVEGVSYTLGRRLPDTETTTVKVHLATGDWTTAKTNARSPSGWNACILFGTPIRSTIFSTPYEREGKTCATVTYAATKPDEYDIRLTATDVRNVEHPPDYSNGLWTSDGFAQITPDFNVPLDDVAAFQLQIRPYTWIEFRNVSLQPGKLQKVEIVTTEPNLAVEEPVKRNQSTDGPAARRDNSSQALQAFHAACAGYLKEHPGSDLPKQPWGLKFGSEQPLVDGRYVFFNPLHYVTSTGYFRTGGFPSLKRQDFESGEASRTPILYCKDLLKQEDGKGTNVLFGDGRVEYVTAGELDRLKAAAAASDK